MVRHPMPYGDLERMRVQRFATLADIDASQPTVEEREEYEAPVRMGMVMYAGVDYHDILRQAEQEADVIVWDGGNNDFPVYAPDLLVTVVDPLRPGHELLYHPGEVNLRMADVVVVNKIDSAGLDGVAQVVASIETTNPRATIIRAASQVTLEEGRSLASKRVLVVEESRTVPRSPTAACRSAPERWPPGTPVRPISSTPGRTRSGRSPPPTPGTPASAGCCRPWDTARRSSPNCGPDHPGRRLRHRRRRLPHRPRPPARPRPPGAPGDVRAARDRHTHPHHGARVPSGQVAHPLTAVTAHGPFVRRMTLPAGADEEKVEAGYEAGILEITIPVPVKTVEGRKMPIARHS
jgi:hypothetical protein